MLAAIETIDTYRRMQLYDQCQTRCSVELLSDARWSTVLNSNTAAFPPLCCGVHLLLHALVYNGGEGTFMTVDALATRRDA